MHAASIGTGPVVPFLHGFPELWYTWRHQLLYLSSRGYRALDPDLRGYGDTDAPPLATSYTALHIVGDVIGLLDKLGIEQIFLVGHDWGAIIAWYFCLLRPDRVKALVNMSVPFLPRNPARKPVDGYRAMLGDDFYICRFQIGTARLITNFLALRSPKPLHMPKDTGIIGGLPDPPSLPSWLLDNDVNYYAAKFNQKGFTGGPNYYRCWDLNWELSASWTGVQIKVPVKFVVGTSSLSHARP